MSFHLHSDLYHQLHIQGEGLRFGVLGLDVCCFLSVGAKLHKECGLELPWFLGSINN